MNKRVIDIFWAASMFLSVLLSFPADAQVYVNRATLGIGGGNDPDLLVEDSSFVVAVQSSKVFTQMDFGRFAFDGTLLDSAYFNFADAATIENGGRCLHKKQGLYYFGFTTFRYEPPYIKFLVLNQALDTVRSGTYAGMDGDPTQIFAMAFDTDSTFIVSGYAVEEKPNMYKWDLWVAKFDTSFNVLWEKRFPDNYPNLNRGYLGLEIELDAYGSAVVTGRGFNFKSWGDTIFHNYGTAARKNLETGGLYWKKDFEGPEGSYRTDVIDNGDGTYYFVEPQIYYRWVVTSETDYTKLRIGLIDTTGSVLWDTITGPRRGYLRIRDFIRTLDGNFYVAGTMNYPWFNNSAAYKFSPTGDSIWYREYVHAGDSLDQALLYSFEQLPDSSFLHVGVLYDLHDPVWNYAPTWILRTDKYGCDTLGCHTVGIHSPPLSSLGFEIYPNPVVSDRLVVESPLEQDASARLLSLTGTVLEEFAIAPGTNVLQLTEKPPAGVYLLELSTGSGAAEVVKIMLR